jgi:CRISPR-associated protein Cas2
MLAELVREPVLGANWKRRVEHVGAKPPADLGGPLIV